MLQATITHEQIRAMARQRKTPARVDVFYDTVITHLEEEEAGDVMAKRGKSEYNVFVGHYMKSHPGSTMRDAAAAWRSRGSVKLLGTGSSTGLARVGSYVVSRSSFKTVSADGKPKKKRATRKPKKRKGSSALVRVARAAPKKRAARKPKKRKTSSAIVHVARKAPKKRKTKSRTNFAADGGYLVSVPRKRKAPKKRKAARTAAQKRATAQLVARNKRKGSTKRRASSLRGAILVTRCPPTGARRRARKTPMRVAARRAAPKRRKAVRVRNCKHCKALVPAHSSAHANCHSCGRPHSLRKHWSHSAGKEFDHSYKIERMGAKVTRKAIGNSVNARLQKERCRRICAKY